MPEKSRQGQGATNKELPKGNCQGQGVAEKIHQDGAAKAEELIGRNETAGEDLPERNGQDQRAATKELPKGSCQGQETPEARDTRRPLPGAGFCRCPSATGAFSCLAKALGRTCHSRMEDRLRLPACVPPGALGAPATDGRHGYIRRRE